MTRIGYGIFGFAALALGVVLAILMVEPILLAFFEYTTGRDFTGNAKKAAWLGGFAWALLVAADKLLPEAFFPKIVIIPPSRKR